MQLISKLRSGAHRIGILCLLLSVLFGTALVSKSNAQQKSDSSTPAAAAPAAPPAATPPAPATAAPAAPADAAPAAPAAPPALGTPDPTGANTGVGLSSGGADNASPAGLNAWTADDITKMQKDKDKPATNTSVLKAFDAAGQTAISLNLIWTLITGYLVMFMQAGFALVETGFCRGKNAAHVMMLNMLVYGTGMLGFWIAGYAFMFGSVGPIATFGGNNILASTNEFQIGGFGLLGLKGFFLNKSVYDVGVYTLFLFQMVFMDTAATIPTGAMAERWGFASFLVYGFVMSIVIYPFYGHMMWGGGGLAQLGAHNGLGHGAVDFAGSSVVHAVGGFAALAGAKVIGPRLGKYKPDGTPNVIPGHNIPMAILGTLILAFGWFGFNPGSTLAATGGNMRIGIIAVNTMLASAAGLVVACLLIKKRTGKFDPGMSANGLLAGLVAITAPCAFVDSLNAVIIGAIAGVIVIYVCYWVEHGLKIDDPVGAFGVHGACGIWGLISVGIFADGAFGNGFNGVTDYLGKKGSDALGVTGILHGDPKQLVAQLIAAVVCMVWAFGFTYIYFKVQSKLFPLRSKAADSLDLSLDEEEFGTLAYFTN